MMGASASAGGGRAAIYTGLVAGVERAGRGYGVTRVERVVQGCSKAFPNSERLAGPRTLSTILFPLCFQYTFLKGNNRRPARRSRFWVRLAGPKRDRKLHAAIRKLATTDAGILESLIHNSPTPPHVIAFLERRAAAPLHPARSPSFQPPIDDNGNPVSHSGKHKPYSTARSLWTASIRVQLSLSHGFQPRHPPAPPTARPHRRLARPHYPALRR